MEALIQHWCSTRLLAKDHYKTISNKCCITDFPINTRREIIILKLLKKNFSEEK